MCAGLVVVSASRRSKTSKNFRKCQDLLCQVCLPHLRYSPDHCKMVSTKHKAFIHYFGLLLRGCDVNNMISKPCLLVFIFWEKNVEISTSFAQFSSRVAGKYIWTCRERTVTEMLFISDWSHRKHPTGHFPYKTAVAAIIRSGSFLGPSIYIAVQFFLEMCEHWAV